MRYEFKQKRTFKERKKDFLIGFSVPFLGIASWLAGAEAGKAYGPLVFSRTTESRTENTEPNEPVYFVEPNELVYSAEQRKVIDVNEAGLERIAIAEPNEPETINETGSIYAKNISQRGIEFIKKYEDFSPTPYPDGQGMSIGYGHQIRKGEILNYLTRETADKLFMEDLKQVYEPIIHKHVKVNLTQGQYDALCSFVYNFGEPKFKQSTLLKRLNQKDYAGASEEFERWVNFNGKPHKGLTKRRAEETQMFLEE